MTAGVLVPAAGPGLRLGPGGPKALRLLAGEPLLVHAIRGLREVAEIGPVVVAAPLDEVELVLGLLSPYDVQVVAGGAHRHDSVARALAGLPPGIDLVLVHDAARCLTPPIVFAAVIAELRAGADAVVPVLEVNDTVKRVDGHVVVETVPRAELRTAQTPQGFRREVLELAHARLAQSELARSELAQSVGCDHTDDAGMVEALCRTVVTVPGHGEAFKVTRPLDLLLAEAVLRERV